MAQNIVLSWLAGCRVMELKTVQVLDELEIPRPCIEMQNVGYNVEWSQELKLEESLEEYVKASMLIELLLASGKLDVEKGFDHVLFDMSCGYDLEGIESPGVLAFMRSMMDATEVVERLRAQLPEELGALRDLDFQTKLSDTLTLSTFHGCPPEEIEKIVEFLMDELSLNCVVKLNPTLLGPTELRRLLYDVMGYPKEIHVPDEAFAEDTKWDQAIAFCERLGDRAERLGLSFGVKFSNTLIVENHRDFFPASETRMYLSGPPLHVLAMSLVRDFRAHFGDRFPISFSAGIDKDNFADSVAIGLVPVTVCTDLLKTGGYGRASRYFKALLARMDELGATTIDEFILLAEGHAAAALDALGLADDDPTLAACRDALASRDDLSGAAGAHFERWVSEAKLLNTTSYVARATVDPRYGQAANAKAPKKVGRHLVLFDCLTCDKCIPVCPNDANFTFTLPKGTVPVVKLARMSGAWVATPAEPLEITKKHQIACFADFCNECGNCDIFCPEDGGPYQIKPLFFGSLADWQRFSDHDGFFLERTTSSQSIRGRFSGRAFRVEAVDGEILYEGEGFSLRFREGELSTPIAGDVAGEVDLTYLFILEMLREALLDDSQVSYVAP